MYLGAFPAPMDRDTKVLALIVIASIAAPLALIAALLSSGVDFLDFMAALMLLIFLPILVLSIYMWATGKGAMFIAGYNTSPKAVRDLYDSKALAKFVGMVVTIFLVMLLIGLELLLLDVSETLSVVLIAVGTIFLFASLVYMNTGGRFLKEGADPSKVVITDKERKRNRAIILAVLGVSAIVLVAVFFSITSGSVDASLGDDALQVTAPFVDENILYADVSSVELRDTFDNGRRVGGFGGTEISSGNFQNDEFGRYTLARYNDVQSCIVVHHANGVLVFNLDTADGTERAFEDLRSRV